MTSHVKNFSALEDDFITREIENRKHILLAAFTASITKPLQELQWEAIATAAKKLSTTPRTVGGIEQRWKNMITNTKKSLGQKMNFLEKKTGGGEAAENLTNREERMLGIIGKPAVCGIENGFDTSAALNGKKLIILLQVGFDLQIVF